MTQQRIDAVLFDLDETLLDINLDLFWRAYMQSLAAAVADLIDPDSFLKALGQSTQVMLDDVDPARTNREVFWDDFFGRTGLEPAAVRPPVDRFYEVVFPTLCDYASPAPLAREAVKTAMALEVPVVVATNPIMPRRGVDHRLRWAGLADLPFALVTTYEGMHACKPRREYYAEIAHILGVDPAACLMIGNDEHNDMSAMDVGMSAFLVEDHAVGTRSRDVTARGSMADVLEYLTGLPTARTKPRPPHTLAATPQPGVATPESPINVAALASEFLAYLKSVVEGAAVSALAYCEGRTSNMRVLTSEEPLDPTPPSGLLGQLRSLEDGVLARALATGDPASSRDGLSPPARFETQFGDAAIAMPIRDANTVVAAAAVYGSAGVSSDQARAHLRQACASVGPPLAVSLKVRAVESELAAQRKIARLAARFGRTLATQELVGVILGAALELSGADTGSIMLLDPTSRHLRIAKAVGVPEQFVAGAQAQVGEGVAGWAAHTGRGLVIDDMDAASPAKSPRRTRSAVCVPMQAPDGKCWGVINVGSTVSTGRFCEVDIEHMTALGRLAALALSNAQELDEQRRSPGAAESQPKEER